MHHWLWLAAAILLEVSGTTCMKLSEGFTKPVSSISMFVLYAASFIALAFALRGIDVGVAYAIWAGVGTALVALIGVVYFGESATLLKVLSIGLVVLGVIGLHLCAGER